ncbi:MAG: hypothetical protein Q8P22_06720 [Chloroflexota bacterium]|nr:hypothetical protein [Chloroflexota bacterium]
MTRFAAIIALVGVLLVSACGGGEKTPEGVVVPSPTVGSASPIPTRTVVSATPVGALEATVPIGKIGFSSRRDGNGEIYLLTAEGETNITNNPAEDAECDLSPDGKKLIFASDREGTYHIYVLNLDGSGLTKLTDAPAGDFSPEWSPDGRRIAFGRTGAIMVMDSDGSNVQPVMELRPEASAEPCGAGAFLGDWSPDGKQLTFYAADVTTGLGQVCTINVDGSGLRVVASEPPGYHVEPAWSPDGEWIAYRFIEDQNHEIYLVKPDGSSRINLTSHPATDIEPAWSPDGMWIAFGSDRTGAFDLYMMKPDGSGAARLTTSGGKDSEPCWGP